MVQLPQFLKALCALPLLLSASACGAHVQIQPTSFVGYTIPEPLLVCSKAPAKLTGTFTQKDVAVYIVKLTAAYSDCFGNVESIRNIIHTQEATLKAQAK